MTARAMFARHRAARLLVVFACLAGAVALAQDPRSILAQKAARDWLAHTDKIDAPVSYDAAGSKFKEAITVDRWDEALQKARAPLGALEQRTVFETTFDKALPGGGPQGEFALVMFRTVFAKKTDSIETVTLEHERDGAWRVIGYYIR